MGLGVVAPWFGAAPARAAGPSCFVPGDYSTIQAAVKDANCTEIDLTAPRYTENISISRSVAIYGGGRGFTSVTSLTPGTSVFQVRNSSPGSVSIVSLHRMTITGGHADFGGGINNVAATLLLDDALVTGNRADTGGGGIYNAGGGKLSLSASTVAGNTAGLEGGGIYNTAALSTSMFDHVPTQQELTLALRWPASPSR